jgi:hypothetical protein
MTNCIVVQRDSHLAQVTLQELHEKRSNRLVTQQNKIKKTVFYRPLSKT